MVIQLLRIELFTIIWKPNLQYEKTPTTQNFLKFTDKTLPIFQKDPLYACLWLFVRKARGCVFYPFPLLFLSFSAAVPIRTSLASDSNFASQLNPDPTSKEKKKREEVGWRALLCPLSKCDLVLSRIPFFSSFKRLAKHKRKSISWLII